MGDHDLPYISVTPHFWCIFHFVSLYNIFSPPLLLLHFPLIISVLTKCSSFSNFIPWPKKVACCLHISFMSGLGVSASPNIVSFDFFAVHEICSILLKNHIHVASDFFCSYFQIVHALHPYIWVGSIYHSWNFLFVSTDFIFSFV